MRREPCAPDDGLTVRLKSVDEPLGILAVRVAAHRRLVDRDLLAAGICQRHQLRLDDRQERFGRLPAVALEPAGEGVRPRHGDLQRRPRRRDPAQPLVLRDGAEAVRSRELADDPVTRALVVRGRPEQPRRRALLDPFEAAVEAEVEVEPRLLAVRDGVEPGGDLVVHGRDHGVLLELGHVVGSEIVEVVGCVLEPARERGSSRSRSFAAPSLTYPRSMFEIETLDYSDVAKTIDHSLLRPELDTDTVLDGVRLALRYDVASATVRPADVAAAAGSSTGRT